MHLQAVHIRRQEALTRIAERLTGEDAVPEEERQAVLDAIAEANDDRSDQLVERPAP